MRKQQLLPFFEKETPSVCKIEDLLLQYNCYRSAICHNLVLLTLLLFGPIYRRNKSSRLEVRVSVLLKISISLNHISNCRPFGISNRILKRNHETIFRSQLYEPRNLKKVSKYICDKYRLMSACAVRAG